MKVEVGQYKEINKGALKAFFSMVIYPEGQKILDCKYFEAGDKTWFTFPQKEIKGKDGAKSEYIPLITYLNKEYFEELKVAILAAIKQAQGKTNAPTQNNKTYAKQTSPIQTRPSLDWGDVAF